MTNLRGTIAVAGLLGLVLAGCGKTTETAAPPADPKAALAASTAGLKEGNYAFTAEMPEGNGKGVVHVPSKSASIELKTTGKDSAGTYEVRLVDPDRWVKLTMDTTEMSSGLEDLAKDPATAKMAASLKEMVELFSGKYWLHLDVSKVKNLKDLDIDLADPDVTGATALLGGVVSAQGDAHTITGTLDATKTGGKTGLLDDDDLKAMGTAAAALPFTATLDDKGRLIQLDLQVPKAGDTPAGTVKLAISGYGEQAAQPKPTGTVKEMPASAYTMLNG